MTGAGPWSEPMASRAIFIATDCFVKDDASVMTQNEGHVTTQHGAGV
jgi:hypothetical protein